MTLQTENEQMQKLGKGKGDKAERGGGGVEEDEEKGKARRRDRLGDREIRDKRKNKTKKDASERKITSVYRDLDEKE